MIWTEIEEIYGFLTISILTYKLHIVTHAIDGQVASLSQCLENGNLLSAYCKCTRTRHFTNNRYLITCHFHSYDRILSLCHIDLYLFTNHILGFRLCQSANMNLAYNRVSDISTIINKICLQHCLRIRRTTIYRLRSGYRQVEWNCCLIICSTNCYRQLILRHNLRIIEELRLRQVNSITILEICYILCATAATQQKSGCDDQSKKADLFNERLLHFIIII